MTIVDDAVLARPGRTTRLMAALYFSIATAAHAVPLALVNGNIVDIEHRVIMAHGVVLVDGGRIVRVGLGGTAKVPANARIIDCRGKWLMPGMVDCTSTSSRALGLRASPRYRSATV